MLDKTYDYAAIEARISAMWESTGAFRAGRALANDPDAKPFSIVIPPPNVTGSLHMGHALNNTLQDVLARFWRMRGRDVLWQPGTDHAGIATQSLVERQLVERKEPSRRDLGREEFLRRVWAWKEESGGTIVNQLKRLGASCDWSRERFTMGRTEDDQMSKAVIKAFVDLYNDGLIYKDKRLVNWDPKLQTAISDLEVNSVETKGHLWYFNYPIKNPGRLKHKHITVATTRPETMLGDMAVAVNPRDKRWAKYVGKTVILPLVGREIPIIADEYADPEQGTGAVKITPAHDFNDFEVGRRHNLAMLNILTPTGELNADVPEPYRGMERFAARKKIVADLEVLDLVEKIEPYTLKVPHGDRSNAVIEPFLTDQWYVNAEKLAQPALQAVRDGKTDFIPENWRTVYYQWMENIQPWCISRQLWWGHRIPAWYGPDGKYFVAADEDAAHELAAACYGDKIELVRDEDVLDTWFSSALWPFSTMGWPEQTPELARYYPTSVLVTGFDILFFWVARMMMMGLYFTKEVPFRDVYMHALVRDEKGAKMSKSKGNVVDPLSIMNEYGADALRFTMAAMAAQGRDVKLSMARIEGYRNFATKLWNAARFAEMNGCVRQPGFDPASAKETVNRWVYAETNAAFASVTAAIEGYRFNDAALDVYRFVWNVFCDWYIEFAKPLLLGDDDGAKAETRAMTAWAMDKILKLLHPFMPFITEQLWSTAAGEARSQPLCLAAWPTPAQDVDDTATSEMRWVIDIITEIRSVRMAMNVPAKAQTPLTVSGGGTATNAMARRYESFIQRLARVSEIVFADTAPPGSAQFVLGGATMAITLANVIDLNVERERLGKEAEKLVKEIEKIDVKLNNADFVAKAPEEVVEENRERRAEAEAAAAKLRLALERLSTAA